MHHTSTNLRPSSRRSRVALASLTLTALALAGCGGDDDDDATASSTTEPSTTESSDTESSTTESSGTDSSSTSSPDGEENGEGEETDGVAAGAVEDFCAGMVAIDALDAPGGDEEPPPEDWVEFAAAVAGPVEQVQAGAPADLADAATALGAIVEDMAAGDGSSSQGPEFSATYEALQQGVRDNCDVEAVDVAAADYTFDMPATLPAGPASVRVTNDGAEPHVLLYVRKPADVTDVDAFLGEYLGAAFSGDPEAMAAYEELNVTGGGPFAMPGEVGTHVTDFTPGDYVYFCPIPVGPAGDGPPHFTLGMQGEFTVEP